MGRSASSYPSRQPLILPADIQSKIKLALSGGTMLTRAEFEYQFLSRNGFALAYYKFNYPNMRAMLGSLTHLVRIESFYNANLSQADFRVGLVGVRYQDLADQQQQPQQQQPRKQQPQQTPKTSLANGFHNPQQPNGKSDILILLQVIRNM